MRIEVLPMGDHATAQVCDRQGLLLVVPFTALRDRFDVAEHGLVNAVNACRKKQGISTSVACRRLTLLAFMPHVHLGFHCLEVVGKAGLDFSAHSLSSPLLEAVEFPVDVHFGGLL